MSDQIKHVVLLMLENRSFDHFLGCMPNVNGIDLKNPRKNLESRHSGNAYNQSNGAARTLSPDPRHANYNVLRQIHGDGLGEMGGFVYDYVISEPRAKKYWPEIMKCFGWGELPIMKKLADSFCVCDQWFSSVPGPTWTNRLFALSGTSLGWVEMPDRFTDWNRVHRYDQVTIFDRLNEKHIPWRIYFGDIPQSLVLRNQWKAENRERYLPMSMFEENVSLEDSSSFPSFVFIEPSYFSPNRNDQHPPSDVIRGDNLIARVYNAIRSNDSLWDSTLLIVTWDEHGGFYDHVFPPRTVSPDGFSQQNFGFDRLGVRVPLLLISKWIKPGIFRLDREDLRSLDHTSILRYLSDKYGLDSLGRRVESAGSIVRAISDKAIPNSPDFLELSDESDLLDESEPILLLNANQAALLEFSEWLESELDTDPVVLQERVLRSTRSLQDRVEVAKERVAEFLQAVTTRAP